jgi:hypothetical protein
VLTELRCRSAKPTDRPYKIGDSKGLHLYVTPTGFKSWRWKYRFARKEKRLVLGSYPDISLAEARRKRDDAARLLSEGIDPSVARKQRAAAQEMEAENMLAHVQQGIEPIYNRAAYMPRRRELAQVWADMLLEGFAPAHTLLLGKRK